jgi:hypothetical protein
VTPEQAAFIAACEAADAAERAAAVAATQAAYPGGKLTDATGCPVAVRTACNEASISAWGSEYNTTSGGVVRAWFEHADGSPAIGDVFADGEGGEWVPIIAAGRVLGLAQTVRTAGGWLPANARPAPEQTEAQAEKAWAEIDAAKEQQALLAQVAALPADVQDRLAYEVEAYTADRWAKIDSGRRKVYAVDTLRAAVEQHAAEKAAAKQAVRSASPFAALSALKMAA